MAISLNLISKTTAKFLFVIMSRNSASVYWNKAQQLASLQANRSKYIVIATLELKKTEFLQEKTPAAGYLCERKNGLLIFQKLLLDTSTRYQILQEQQNKWMA